VAVDGVEQWVATLGVWVERGGVMPVVGGGLLRDGDAAGFGSLADEVDGEAFRVEVADGGSEHLGVAGGGVVHQDHEELVPQSGPAGRVGLGEERFDGLLAHVGDGFGGGRFHQRDACEIGKVDGQCRLGGGGVLEEGPDAGEALVVGRRRPVPFGACLFEEPGDAGAVQHRESDLVDGDGAGVADVTEEHVQARRADSMVWGLATRCLGRNTVNQSRRWLRKVSADLLIAAAPG